MDAAQAMTKTMPKSKKIVYQVAADAEALSLRTAELFADCIAQSIAARGLARIAVSGGSTPRRTFEMLADSSLPLRARVDWSRLFLFWVDERCVPPDHADSNYHMTREALLAKVPLPEAQILRMEGELDPQQAAARYESTLRNQFRLEGAEVPCFDLIALGMGDDGHTASLFPGTEALQEWMRLVAANFVPQKDTWRITLTAPVLNHARNVVFQIAGKNKASVLRNVLLGPYDPEGTPSQLICTDAGSLLFLLDKDAAAQLPAPDKNGIGMLEVKR